MVANYALPYTIGTPKFFSSRYVGLVDETGRMNRRKDELGESIASQGSIPRSYEDNVVAAPYSNTKEHSIPFQSKPSVKVSISILSILSSAVLIYTNCAQL